METRDERFPVTIHFLYQFSQFHCNRDWRAVKQANLTIRRRDRL
jgi:hypothetical protein